MCSTLLKKIFGKKKVKLLMLGLDDAGKKTVRQNFQMSKVVSRVPTIGFDVDTVKYKNIHFTIWHVSGQTKIRPLWKHYFEKTEAIIYVIDSSNRECIEESRKELMEFLEDQLNDTVLLVFANKQDVPDAMKLDELSDQLELHSLSNHCWFIQGTCATKGDGIYEGLDWLVNQLK